ncbi:MAG: hypothetical protein IJT44_12805 [Clostridia bacterium]|nr:hypothetical protein [Clostridia bacterium]
MSADRVVFYGRSNTSYYNLLDRLEELDVPDFESVGINDAIEFHEIRRCLDYNYRPREWTDEQYDACFEKSNKLNRLAMRFFNAITENNIIDTYKHIDDYSYKKCFWAPFAKCKLYERISPDVFDRLLHTCQVSLGGILAQSAVVKKYGAILLEFILESPENIKYLLRCYEQNYDAPKTDRLYLPSEITTQDILNLFNAYIESDNPDISVLERIVKMRDNNPFCLSDMVRYKAQKRYEQRLEEISKHAVLSELGIRVSFSPDQTKENSFQIVDGEHRFSFSTEWLLDTLDYPSIMNNFIYVFGFAEPRQMRCTLVSNNRLFGSLESIFRFKSSRYYPDPFAFQTMDQATTMMMHNYYSFLKRNGVRLESVLEWVFTQYLQEEFQCPEIRLALPSEGTTFAEKCDTICSAMESVFRQYSLFVDNGSVEFDLLAMMSDSKKIGDIPSQVKDKYIYEAKSDISSFKSLFFKHNYYVAMVRPPKTNNEYETFFDLIMHEKVFLTDYREDMRVFLREAEEKGLLTIDEDGLLQIGNGWKITILHDLFKSNVISRWHYPPEAQPVIQEWLNNGYLITKSSLFSKPETDYFDYILNNSTFDNGLKLRNKYAHGNQHGIIDERVHEQNYYILLKLFVVLAIKVNDDFVLAEQQKEAH